MIEIASVPTTLGPALRDLEETVSDLRDASFQYSESIRQRFVHQLDEEPLASFLKAVLPVLGFDGWRAKARSTIGSMVRSGTLEWPPSRAERVAMQVALCSALPKPKLEFERISSSRERVNLCRRTQPIADLKQLA